MGIASLSYQQLNLGVTVNARYIENAVLRIGIILIGIILPALQKWLIALTKQLKAKCHHPYAIGWQTTSTGLVMTRGDIGCPKCGLEAYLNGGHTANIPGIFLNKPTHWITKDAWKRMFRCTFAERIARVKELGLGKPPTPRQSPS